MGWKIFRDHFSVRHPLYVSFPEPGVNHQSHPCLVVGSKRISNLFMIDMETGELHIDYVFNAFIEQNYPQIIQASREEILSLFRKPDVFENAFPVYTFSGSSIIEHKCEVRGCPNLTHEGLIMYRDRFSDTPEGAARLALREAESRIEMTRGRIVDLRKDLHHFQTEHAKAVSEIGILKERLQAVS